MSGDITPYLALVTSEHAGKPKFMLTLAFLLQPIADTIAELEAFPSDFDLDAAVGHQLDVVGQWVGRSRYLDVPLTGVYFSFGVAGLGFGEGTWKGPFDPTSGLVRLADDAYRTLLRAVIAANSWDGTIPGAYNAFNNILFAGKPYVVLIQDNQDMTMITALWGPSPDAVTLALFESGELSLKPSGVEERFFVQSVPNVPYFGFGVENQYISGFGVGAWGTRSATL